MFEYRIEMKFRGKDKWYHARFPHKTVAGYNEPKTMEEAERIIESLKCDWDKWTPRLESFNKEFNRSAFVATGEFRIMQREVTEWEEVNGK